MKADLTRRSFDPLRHFSRVLMQQGRVQLDADWNEQNAILLHLLRRLIRDAAGPIRSINRAFEIEPIQLQKLVVDDVAIVPGDLYLDGILCELEASPIAIVAATGNTITVAEWTIDGASYAPGQYLGLTDDDASPPVAAIEAKIVSVEYRRRVLTMDRDVSALSNAVKGRARRMTTYLTQPDLPQLPPLASGKYQLYLDVWERVITCLEDDNIREVALNGPDTAARAQVVWQVKALPFTQEGEAACIAQQTLNDELQPWHRGLLRARTEPALGSTDPCTISPDSRYRGPENQLYRVEIHTGSHDTSGRPASFKWSRENGAVVFPIIRLATGDNTTTVTLENLGRDDRFGLREGDFVEVQDDRSVLANIPGILLQVRSIDRTGLVVVLSGTTTPSVGADSSLHPLLRRWDHQAGDPAAGGLTLGQDNAALISSGAEVHLVTNLAAGAGGVATAVTSAAALSHDIWLNLEDGVQIAFTEPVPATYRTGDYWLIPARVATGDLIWPQETGTDAQGNVVVAPVARRPDGVEHHYAPLAVVTVDGQKAPLVQLCSEGAVSGMITGR